MKSGIGEPRSGHAKVSNSTWDVERMKAARIVVLGLALGAGGLAALLMSGGERPPPAPAPPPGAQLDTVDVLVASKDIGIGYSLSGGDLAWQKWPSSSAGSFIRRPDRPDAIEQLAGAVARAPIGAGEPVRENRLIKAKGSGYMAAI